MRPNMVYGWNPEAHGFLSSFIFLITKKFHNNFIPLASQHAWTIFGKGGVGSNLLILPFAGLTTEARTYFNRYILLDALYPERR